VEAPSDNLRARVQSRCEDLRRTRPTDSRIVNAALEDGLDQILDEISEALHNALEQGTAPPADEALSRIEGWLSLASYATVRAYGPESAWWSGLADWRPSVARRLRRITEQVQSELVQAAAALGADGWSIGAGFPA
jgi:hypothetical protein